jgi:hypothetical protein
MGESRLPMSLYQAFNRDKEQGGSTFRLLKPSYESIAQQAIEHEMAISFPKKLLAIEERINRLEISLSLMREAKKSDTTKSQITQIGTRIAQIEAQIGLESVQIDNKRHKPNLVVPHELRVLKGKAGKIKNRAHEIVQKRWNLWKAQYESGAIMKTIARAWKCDHTSIAYAKKKGWIAGHGVPEVQYKKRRKKK